MIKIVLAFFMIHCAAFGSASPLAKYIKVQTNRSGAVVLDVSDAKTMGDVRQKVESVLGLKGGKLVTMGKSRQDTEPFDIGGRDAEPVYIIMEMKEVFLPVMDTFHDNKVIEVPFLYGSGVSSGRINLNPDLSAKARILYTRSADNHSSISQTTHLTVIPELVEEVQAGKIKLIYGNP